MGDPLVVVGETNSVELKRDDTFDLITTLREQVHYERKEKERYRDLLHRYAGLADSVVAGPETAAPIHESLPGYKPWSEIRGELEAHHAELARKKRESAEESKEERRG